MKKKLSVIIPVYNVEKYLDKCVDSICNQTYDNLEIILVDDGSTDQSLKKCTALSLRDNRVKVFHKPNGGLVSARKFGVEKANGDMVAFVDGDDWIEPDMYENMISRITSDMQIHLITSGLIYEWDNRKSYKFDGLDEGIYSLDRNRKEILYNLIFDERLSRQNILTSVCNKLFDSTILKKAICNVDDGVTLGEDGVLLCNFIAMSKNVYVTHYVGYHYIQHDDSMIHKNNLDSFGRIHKLKRCFEESMDKLGLKKIMQRQIDYYTRCFVDNVVWDVYNIKNTKVFFSFPYEDLEKEKRVIIYGFGQVGYSYWKYINDTKCLSLVGVADKNYIELCEYGNEVESLDILMKKGFDYIIIAVENEKVAISIKEEMKSLHIDEEKILWRPVKWKIW